MKYLKKFNPDKNRLEIGKEETRKGHDVRDGSIYVYSEKIVLAVNVAISTGRPLLLLGEPGSGKSSLASFIARTMNWNYYEKVISSRTQAQDLLWSVDAVRRLRDAQANQLDDKFESYIEPGVFWWAFNPESAGEQGRSKKEKAQKTNINPPGIIRDNTGPSVVLLDEIDKAEPDVPNDLLVTIGSQFFRVKETDFLVKPSHTPLVIITSNNERSLPGAFIRRCVVLTLTNPDESMLVDIACNHFPDDIKQKKLFQKLAKKVCEFDSVDFERYSRPSTPEYLDAVRACLELRIQPDDSELWKIIEEAVLVKKINQ